METTFTQATSVAKKLITTKNKFVMRSLILTVAIILGIGHAWGGTTYYSKVTTSQSPTGKGTVYVVKGSTFSGTATSATQDVDDNKSHTYSLKATPTTAGYYFVNWTSTGSATLSFTNASNASTTCTINATSTDANSRTTGNAQANWAEITINNGTASPATIAAEDNSTTSTANTCAITYVTKGDAQNDFKTPSVGSATGNGTFTATWGGIASDGKATVDVKFVGDGTYGGKNKDAANRSRSSSAVVTLTSTLGNNKGTCTVNASFPNIIVSAGEGADMYTTNGEPKSASATFPVQWADDADDFTAAFSGATGGGEWTVDAITYTATDNKSGVITVDYTFDNQRDAEAAGTVNHSAVLTLSANTNAGGASNTVTLNAESKKAASGDAIVISGSDETEYETLADAIEAANLLNTNPTVRLLRNVDLGTLTSALEIKKPMTLDLASFEISATVNSSVNKLFYLNSATAALTVNDSKNGGAITVTGSHTDFLYAILVDKGALNIAKGDITISNTNTGATAKVAAVCVGSNGRLLMSGGNLTATTAGSYAYGVITTTVPSAAESTVGITGGTITATAAKTMGIGIYCQSTSATASGDPTAANVVLSGVTVNASAEGTTDAYAIQVDAGVSLLINSGNYTATSKTQNAYALNTNGYVAVVNGTFNANATTLLARAIHLTGGITAVRNGSFTATAATDQSDAVFVASGAKLLTYGGTFTGRLTDAAANARATGAYVNGGALEAQGGEFIGNVAKTGLGAVQTNYAAGVYAYTGSTVSLASAVLRGQTANVYVNGAYGLYTTTANALGLTNCTLYGTGAHQYAYGIYNAGTQVTMNNTTLEVNSTKEYSYGIYTNAAAASVEARNSTINSTSASTYAYGAYVANGTLNASNTTFDVTVSQTAAANSYLRGIYVAKSKSAFLTDCKVTATGTAAYSNNGYGLYVDGSIDVENTEVTVTGINSGAYAIVNSANTGLINVASGKFKATATSTGVAVNGTAAAAKQKLYGGYYTTNTNLSKYLADGYMVENLTAGDEFNAGYKYQVRPAVDLPDPVCKIGSVNYGTLEEALEYASKNATNSNKLTILMVKDYTLQAGNYTLPQYTTLLIPLSGQTSFKEHPDRKYSYTSPTVYRTLTFADGVKMDVWGTIETGGNQSGINQLPGNNGMVTESYGRLHLKGSSSITLESGSKLYAWGYVTGDFDSEGKYVCEIDAKRGSTVYEFIQIKDWRGGTCTKKMYQNPDQAFPFNQFYVQNVECPIKFRPGSKEICDLCVNALSSAQPYNGVNFIGVKNTSSFFEMDDKDMSEDTWVRKWYNAKIDQQVYDINSNASMNSIILTLYSYTFNSANYVLPVPNNMKIHLLTGKMDVTQNTELTPGAEIEIDKEATVYVNSGKSLYVFDINEWVAFATNIHTYPLPYSPSWAGSGKTCPRAQKITTDASVNVHGKLVVNGNLYTTAGGANIFSSNEDAGIITYGVAAPSSSTTIKVANNTGPTYTSQTANPAWLQNEDGTHEETKSTAKDKSWIYYDGKWNCWEEKNCFGYDNEDKPYAKPRAWVQLVSDVADLTTHLYTDAETGNRAFILEDGCQWWEVEPTPYDGNKYKCVDPDYDGRYKYYEYVNSKWQEAVVTITWKNGTATLATYDNALYGVRPTYLHANPTKTKTTNEYYTWLGWTKGSETGEFFAKDAELPEATGNTTYYAYFQTNKFQYTITLKNYDEAVLDAKRWNAGETPIYAYTPLKPSTTAKEYTFDGWATSKTGGKAYEIDGLPAASAAATYYAHYAESDRNYTITWVNYNGVVLKEEKVVYNTTPSAPVTPTRPNDTYYTYTFDAWSPAVSAVTGNQTYTATYTYEKLVPKYTVTFKNGSVNVFSQTLKSGETPVFDGTEPTKDATAQYTYTFDGWSTTNGGALAYDKGAALPALTADVTYYAHFASTTNNYKVLWKSEDGKTLYETDPSVPYNSDPVFNSANPTKARVGATVYSFDGWSATIGGAKLATLPKVTENKVFFAHFSDNPVFTVIFNAKGHGTAPDNQEIVSGGIVIKPADLSATGYTFGGWYKESGCTNPWNFSTDNVTANTTLYAKWTAITYDLTYEGLNGATNSNPATYTIETATITLANPGTREGYTFTGWTCGGSPITQIAQGSTGDKTITANWTANTNTAYTVKHFKEKLEGGYNAEPDETDNLTGTTGASVTPAVKSYEGFDSPATQTVSILADGSRVVTYNYTRKSYNLSWVTDGDALTGSYTHGDTKFGAAITAPNTPTKTGYTFAGWSPAKAETMPAAATEYTATWTINQYTLTVLSADETMGTVTGGGLYDYNTAHTITASPNPGFKFVKWNDDNTNASREVTVTADVTYTATFDYDIANYTVKHWKQNIYDDDYTEEVADRQTNLSGTIGAQTNAEAKEYTGFEAQPITQQTIVLENTAVVNIYYNRKVYTITWRDAQEALAEDKQTIATEGYRYEAIPSYSYDKNGNKPEGDVYTYTVTGWSVGKNVYPLSQPLPAVEDNATYTAIYTASVEHKVVSDAETLTGTLVANLTTVRPGGRLNVTTGSLTTTDFVLEATLETSGELLGDVKADNVYFDLKIDDPAPRHWHAFSVPFQVNLKKAGKPIQINGETLTLGRGYDIVYYDGAARAVNGKSPSNWTYVEDGDSVLVPGRAYMIASASRAIKVVRFTKDPDSSAPLHFAGTMSVDKNYSVKTADCGWNSFGNPMTYHTIMDANFKEFQVHNGEKIGSDGYVAYSKDDYKRFVVGKAVFVQVGSDDNIDISPATNETVIIPAAPRRTKAERSSDKIDVCIAPQDGEMADRLYLAIDENKIEDKYMVVADLAKLGTSTVRAQMWVNRYGEKLCKNTVAPIHGQADYPLGIFVPADGEYEIYTNTKPNDEVIYLTFDGRPIWNLNFGPYTGNFEKGTTERYGLRRVQTVATDIDNLTIDGNDSVRKMLVDDKVYIIRNGETYTITGQIVK